MLLLFVCLMVTAHAQESKQKLIRVLIVDGYSNHDWKQTTALVKNILEESRLFKVSVSTAPATVNADSLKNWQPGFNSYDVVILNTNNIQDTSLRWPVNVEKQLEKYVAPGGGLYFLHSSNNAFPHWKAYDTMMGLGWQIKERGFAVTIDSNKKIVLIPPGIGNGTSHGARFDATIHILNPYPINNNFPAEWITPSMELYTYARGPAKNMTVLSYAFDSATQKNWPVEWIVQYGKGRVYNSSMGHLWKGEVYPVSYRCIGFQTTIIRAVEWLATGKVSYPVPAKFSRKIMSVRDETDMPNQ